MPFNIGQLSLLRPSLSSGSHILTDPKSEAFLDLMQRWTDIDLKIPSAIILPSSEEDCQKVVQWAVHASIPFVVKSGGHSEWSTIGSEGIIIDLAHYCGIDVDETSATATLKGSILSKEVGVALAEKGMCTALGNGNTVGAIPYFLGGGVGLINSLTGFGSDQILSARMISAKGELIEVKDSAHPDLLYAIRGAGQFFGLVTQLTIKTHPLSILGNDRGVIWAGLFVFPLTRVSEVCSAMKIIIDDDSNATSGLMMIMAPPPARTPSLIISARSTGDPSEASNAFKLLYDLGPVVANGGEVTLQNASNARAAICAKGDLKRFGIVGLYHFDADAFAQTAVLWKDMVATCPDAINSAFNFQWDSRPVKQSEFESAMSLHDIRYWQNNLIWHTDVSNRTIVDEFNNKCIALMRGPDEANYVDYQNGTRVGPIERRYKGVERLARLKLLKKEWDPKGLFTKQLLE